MLGGEYLVQTTQPGEFSQFRRQPVLLGNGGGVNPRKRGREASDAKTWDPTNLLSLQPQLHIQQLPVVSTGLKLSLQDQNQQQLQQRQHLQQQKFGLLFPPSILSCISEDLAAEINQQRDEIDRFLQAQGDQLRRTLAERRESHYRALMAAAEKSASRRLQEKAAEVEKAARRNAELTEQAAHLKTEAHAWQARARAQEVAAASLQAQLQQAIARGAALDKREELGCAGGETPPAEDECSAIVDPCRTVSAPPMCRICRKRYVSVVLLPCRHLCLCNGCDSAVDTCPLCHSTRSSSVEVYL